MPGQTRLEPVPLDTRRWTATREPLAAGARDRHAPLVVSVAPADAGAFLDDGSSVRRQLTRLAPLIERSVATRRRTRRAEHVVLLAPSAWIRLAWPMEGAGAAATPLQLARQLEAVLGDLLARLPIDAAVLGAHFVAPASRRSDFDGLFVFDHERRVVTWAGARLDHGGAPRGLSLAPPPPDPERDAIACVPGLGPTLLLNDHQLVSLARADSAASAETLAAARRLGVRHLLHCAYGAGSPGMWAARLARVAQLLPDVNGWASASRTTPVEPRVPAGLVSGVDHLPLSVRLEG